jgi:hypothetical protein
MISGTRRGALTLLFASQESSFNVPSDCYSMAAHRMMGLIVERASHVRECPRCYEGSLDYRGFGSASTVSGTSMSVKLSASSMRTDHIRGARALGMPFSSTIKLSTCLKSSCLKRGLLRGGTFNWWSAAFGWKLLDIDMGMWCG